MTERLVLPIQSAYDNNGDPLAGAKLEFFEAGTSTPLDTYSDSTLSTANTNPVIADSSGRFGDVFMQSRSYKVVLKNSSDVTIWTADPYIVGSTASYIYLGTSSGSSSAYTFSPTPGIDSYEEGATYRGVMHTDSADGAITLNISAQGTKNLKKYDGSGNEINLEAGDLQQDQAYDFIDTGTNIVVLNPTKTYNIVFNDSSELTIATGAITVTRSRHTVDTESDASSDVLDSITAPEGMIFTLSLENTARNVTITNNTKFKLADNEDFNFNGSADAHITFLCIDSSSTCVEIARNENTLNVPAFRATMSGDQTVTTGILTKVQFDTEDFDTNSNYDHSTNYRLTPTVAGKYYITANLGYNDGGSNPGAARLEIHKNGTSVSQAFDPFWDNGDCYLNTQALVTFNGTTDYVEIFALISGTGNTDFLSAESEFNGFKLF